MLDIVALINLADELIYMLIGACCVAIRIWRMSLSLLAHVDLVDYFQRS